MKHMKLHEIKNSFLAESATQFNFAHHPGAALHLVSSGLRSAGRGKRLLACGRATLALQPSRLRVKQPSSAFTLIIATSPAPLQNNSVLSVFSVVKQTRAMPSKKLS